MGRTVYNKLIRDRIPEIITQSGKAYGIEVMSLEEYEQALLEKIVEEAMEVRQADNEHIKTELADLQEVIDGILFLKGISRQSLRIEQRSRRNLRGGFRKRLRLLWTE